LGRPATEDELRELERALGFSVPVRLRTFLGSICGDAHVSFGGVRESGASDFDRRKCGFGLAQLWRSTRRSHGSQRAPRGTQPRYIPVYQSPEPWPRFVYDTHSDGWPIWISDDAGPRRQIAEDLEAYLRASIRRGCPTAAGWDERPPRDSSMVGSGCHEGRAASRVWSRCVGLWLELTRNIQLGVAVSGGLL